VSGIQRGSFPSRKRKKKEQKKEEKEVEEEKKPDPTRVALMGGKKGKREQGDG